jgi:hypothetical protein
LFIDAGHTQPFSRRKKSFEERANTATVDPTPWIHASKLSAAIIETLGM